MNMRVPPLDRWSGSWVVTRRSDGKVIGEFYDRRNVERFNSTKVVVETAHQYLVRVRAGRAHPKVRRR